MRTTAILIMVIIYGVGAMKMLPGGVYLLQLSSSQISHTINS